MSEEEKKPRRGRGFLGMTPEERKRIAGMGGRAAQMSGKAHRFSSELAKIAGSKGGKIIAAREGHMRTIGSKGGRSAATKSKRKSEII